jgi:hypothetical protein
MTIGPDENGEFEKIIGPTPEQADHFNHMESAQGRRERRAQERREQKIEKLQSTDVHRDWRLRKTVARLPWYKKATIVLPMAGALAFGGVAAAYFVAEGSGSGSSHVTTQSTGSSVPVTVTSMGPNGAALLGTAYGSLTPNAGGAALTGCGCEQDAEWNIATAGPNANVATLTATVVVGTGGVVENQAAGNALVPGCLASWFVVGPATLYDGSLQGSNVVALPTTISAAANQNVGAPVYLLDSGTNQDACGGISPLLSLSVS